MLLRTKKRISYGNAYPDRASLYLSRWMEPDDVVDEPPAVGFGGSKAEDWERLPDPRDEPVPETPAALRAECEALAEWIKAEHLRWHDEPWLADGQRVVTARLDDLLGTTVDLDLPGTLPSLHNLDERRALHILNGLRRRATEAVGPPGTKSKGGKSDQPKPKRRRRTGKKKLSARQLQAAQLYGECKGNMAEVARQMRVCSKTARQHYQAALRRLGRVAVKHLTGRLPTDRRGQENVADGDDERG